MSRDAYPCKCVLNNTIRNAMLFQVDEADVLEAVDDLIG